MSTDELKAFRQTLHQNPELSGEEKETQQLILNTLAPLQPDRLIPVGGTGVLVSFKSKNSYKSVLIRGDIDALPIQEINDFSYKSTKKGVAHKCGHDGHTTILIALANKLKKAQLEHTDVHLVFQPAEEIGEGAYDILHDPKFDISPDFVFALHNIPGYEKNQVIVKEGSFTPAARSMVISLTGKTSHAAEPENGINPGAPTAEIIQALLAMANPDIETNDFFLVTTIFVELGERAYGTSPGESELGFTFRSWNNKIMKEQSAKATDSVQAICKKYGIGCEINWTQEFFSNQNDTEAVNFIRKAASKLTFNIKEKKEPFKWGEDFGLYTKKFRGAMFGLGAGVDTPALHNPDYDFPDDLIESGSDMFYQIIHLIDEN